MPRLQQLAIACAALAVLEWHASEAEEVLPAIARRPAPLAPQGETPRPSDSGDEEPFTPSAEFQRWITDVVREQLPDNYEKRKNWGHTAKAFDGISVRFEDGQIKTHRKYKDANDGEWQHYRVNLKDPAEQFDIRIAKIREIGPGRVGLEVTAVAKLEVFGRQSLWQHGVQLYSVSAEADARVRLWTNVEIAARMDWTRFPPDVTLDPQVVAARFEIPDFRIRRIGGFQGPVVRSLSHSTREALEAKLEEDNHKLIAKLNRAIAKQEKHLKLSLADVMASKWRGIVEPPMP